MRIERPCIKYARCGTQDEWNEHKNKYDVSRVIPCTLYVNKNTICLVTSQEWSDWLQGKSAEMPENKGV